MSPSLASTGQGRSTPLDGAVSALMTHPVVVDSTTPVGEVARRMTSVTTSAAIVVTDGLPVGIVTDADLRSRHIAAGRHDGPVGEVASGDLSTIGPDRTVAEALGLMARRRIHHIPVVDRGLPVGMLDAGTVLAAVAGDPLRVLATAGTATDVAALARAHSQLPAVVSRMVAAGSGGLAVVRLLSLFTEQVIARVVALAIAELGPAPGRYAILALGSLARLEQTLVTDQDHALVIADGYADHPWFARFGERVTDGLTRAGFPPCPGGVMIANEEWRDDETGWRRRWEHFVAKPDPEHVLASNIALDVRPVDGDPALAAPFSTVATRAVAANAGPFLLFLANSAREHEPPLGLFHRWRLPRTGQHQGAFDVKRGAVLPIVQLARVHAIAGRSPAVGTVERLADAAGAGQISADSADILARGYDLVTRIRLDDQARRSLAGADPDNWLAPADLSAWDRAGLREVCRTIKVAQGAIAQSYQGAYLP